MVLCEQCQEWFHDKCETVPDEEWTNDEFKWYCRKCNQRVGALWDAICSATLRKELLVVRSSWRAARSCSFVHIFPPEAILHNAK